MPTSKTEWDECSKCRMTKPKDERCHMCASEAERDALKRLEAAAREVVRHNPCACFSGNPCAIHAALDALDEARKK